jgi:hypothetical protein
MGVAALLGRVLLTAADPALACVAALGVTAGVLFAPVPAWACVCAAEGRTPVTADVSMLVAAGWAASLSDSPQAAIASKLSHAGTRL